jgi:branched-chain amino acid transport system ATP-binding protein
VILEVDAIDVAYSHVVQVLHGVSLQVPQRSIVTLLGGNGAGKTTTLRAVSSLLAGERGAITRGAVRFDGERIDKLGPAALVRRGLVQVMEGRHCFGHLTIEENLLTGAWTRTDGPAAVRRSLDAVYAWFPRLLVRRRLLAAHTSGGEQQMCAIGRALMANPKLVLLDEPSMGLAPMLVDEVFGIVRALNKELGVAFLIAEQNSRVALRHAHRACVLDTGRVVLEGDAKELARDERVREAYLGVKSLA